VDLEPSQNLNSALGESVAVTTKGLWIASWALLDAEYEYRLADAILRGSRQYRLEICERLAETQKLSCRASFSQKGQLKVHHFGEQEGEKLDAIGVHGPLSVVARELWN
jgi:hypothetical protein